MYEKLLYEYVDRFKKYTILVVPQDYKLYEIIQHLQWNLINSIFNKFLKCFKTREMSSYTCGFICTCMNNHILTGQMSRVASENVTKSKLEDLETSIETSLSLPLL